MKISLVGLLDDGSPRRAGVPVNPRNTITISQGGDVIFEVKVQATSGTLVDLHDVSTSMIWSVKKKPADQPALIRSVAARTVQTATFTLTPADTKNLTPGRYVYDVWLTLGGKRDAVIPLSTLILEAAATPPP